MLPKLLYYILCSDRIQVFINIYVDSAYQLQNYPSLNHQDIRAFCLLNDVSFSLLSLQLCKEQRIGIFVRARQELGVWIS